MVDLVSSPLLTGIRFGLLLAGFAFIWCDRRRTLCAKGTHERYVYASYCRALQWPALLWPAMGVAVNLLSGLFLLVPLDLWLAYLVWERVQAFRKSDDDDFWSKLGKKLKRKARAFLRSAKQALAPQPALQPIPVQA